MKHVLFFILIPLLSFSQDCHITLSGYVLDEHTREPLAYASLVLGDNVAVTIADETGYFTFTHLCASHYHLVVSHLACEQEKTFIHLTQDTSLNLFLEHHTELLNTVTVSEKRKVNSNSSTSSARLEKQSIDKRAGESIGEILSDISGVNSVSTGTDVHKPMIHGLFGNRITLIHNGFSVGGQNWGIEHAPEIDPFSVNDVLVIKGAAALKYTSNAMGGAVLMNDKPLPSDYHLHGRYNFSGLFNGLKFSNNLLLEGGIREESPFKWRVQGSYTRSGDARSPHYFLSNTGAESGGANISLGRIKTRYATTLAYTYYIQKSGILKGSHIGNLTDLYEAFHRDKPFGTASSFSYTIQRPYQKVQHHNLHLKHKHYLEKGRLSLAYNFQYNNRQEFDVRRSSEKPSLFLYLMKQNGFVAYESQLNKWTYTIGSQYGYTLNFNDEELNVSPLIPNYNKQQAALFFIHTVQFKQFAIDAGIRYTFQHLVAKYFENRARVHDKKSFHCVTLNTGISYAFNNSFKARWSTSFVRRAPEINEMYSNGLHHGAAAIERGDKTIDNEQMWLTNVGFTFSKPNRISIEISPYYQYFFNYIDLVLQEDAALTIRGAFPVYHYRPSKAHIWGFDFSKQTYVYKNLSWVMQSAIVRGKNLEQNAYLSFMPADYIKNSLQYVLGIQNHEMNFSFGVKNVWQQVRTPSFDFVESPKGYTLLNAEVGGMIRWSKTELMWSVRADNLLNTAYRNYLNRWRYFSDEIGTQLALRLRIKF